MEKLIITAAICGAEVLKEHNPAVPYTVEMFTRAKQIVASPNTPGMLALVAAGVFYYVFNYVVAFAMEKWEQALRYYR